METGIPAPGRYGEPNPRLGRNRTQTAGGNARISDGDPHSLPVRNAGPETDPFRTRGTLARRHRGLRALLLTVSPPDPRPRPRLDPVNVGVLGRSAPVPSRARSRASTSRLDLSRP